MALQTPSRPIDRVDAATPAWSVRRIAAHQLAPGVVSLFLYMALAWLLRDSWVPKMAVLFLSILFGEAPVSWYLMIRAQRRERAPSSFAALFPWHRHIGLVRTVSWGLALAIGGMISVFGLAALAEPVLQRAFFDWVPGWLALQTGPEALSTLDRDGLVLLWALSGVVGIGVGGVTQELYHRGFLLPRSSHLGWLAVPLNAVLFALGHLIAPWGWPFFFLAATLWGAAVYRWRSIQVGLAGHLGMLTLGWLMMTAVVFGWVPVP
jgi:hypothetical protein